MSTTIKVNVNLVTVRAVVRDRQGNAVGNLRQEQFHIFDAGKPQSISRFSMEESAALRPDHTEAQTTPAPVLSGVEQGAVAPALPDRYIALVFDDINDAPTDLMRLKLAADKHLAEAVLNTDRVAIFTTSGRTMLDFTNDRARLRDTLLRVQSQNTPRTDITQCPYMNYYMADLIVNKNDQRALKVVAGDVKQCMHLRNDDRMAESIARSAAMTELQTGGYEIRAVLLVLQDVIRRMSSLPGQRSVLLASPGFLVGDRHLDCVELMERAIRSNVVINTLDSRGLYVDTTFKAENPGSIRLKDNSLVEYQRQSDRLQADVLQAFADATGGTFVHNTNDLGGGMRRLTNAPEYTYVLAFSPQGLKRDGKYHALKVMVTEPKLTVFARQGYYAPKHIADPEEAARHDIEDALFSQQEIRDIPFELHTEFFKTTADNARLSVVTRVDVRSLSFRKDSGRSCNKLNVVSGVFDRNGKFLEGMEKVIELRLRDRTLDGLKSGISVKSGFGLNPGQYVVRVVVRDTEGQQLSARSALVDIP